MSKQSPSVVLSESSKKVMLEELWRASVFDESLFELLSSIAEKGENNEILSSEKIYLSLTTNRNRNLINSHQQKILQASTVGFFGLSVGSHAVTTWISQSRANNVKIIDPDYVSATNLNRLRLPWRIVGQKKSEITKNIIKELHPFCNIFAFHDVTDEMYQTVFSAEPKIVAVVDEIDDLEGKIILRKLAQIHRIPLISATDVGDNVIVDVERYDTQPDTKMFLGRIKDIEHINPKDLNLTQRISLVLRIVGLDSCSISMLESLLQIGKTLETWPQLAATATIAGGVITTVLKKIFLKENVLSGRYIISMDSLFLQPETDEMLKIKDKLIMELEKKYPFFV